MKPTLRVGLAFLVATLREREPLFWFVVFPLLLLSILTLVFGELGKEGTMNFSVALANLDATPGGFAQAVETVFEALSTPPERGKEALFTLRRPRPGEEAAFLTQATEDLRRGKLALLVVIPPGFHAQVLAALGGGPMASLQAHVNGTNAASGMAADIVEQVVTRFNQEVLAQAGRYRPEAAVVARTEWIGESKNPVAYVDFLLPGIVLMAFFVGGLFSVPGTILYGRDMKILRRYWVTPLRVGQYLGGFALGYLGMCALQLGLLVLVGKFAFGAAVTFLTPLSLLYLALAAATFLAFGFLITSLVKTAQAGMALANILNMPMMFLSGLFFPVANLPPFLRAVLYVNPLSYLAEGLRYASGTGSLTMPALLTFLVPGAWIALSVAVASRRLSWDVGR
ncbi:MAG: ABC transporter permease [Candidatus Bipolaricaulota bacterium]|nr:ABC transporter permease [Candidatus Bipolaricaulota bacterium]